jgi:probable addiction module antidote protein
MPLKTKRFNVQDYLKTHADQVDFLEAALEEKDFLPVALGEIAKARGVAKFAREAGLSREVIYKAFRPGGNPTLDTITKAAGVLGLKLTFASVKPKRKVA